MIMKKLIFALTIMLAFTSCTKDDEPERNEVSIIPDSFLNRQNKYLGTVELSNREITISVWDHGQIDGDIISIYVNGKVLIAEKTLNGPIDKFVVKTTLEYNGYNYLLLFAHNEGSIPPNTASISINDGVDTREFILEANLQTNGTVDLIVD